MRRSRLESNDDIFDDENDNMIPTALGNTKGIFSFLKGAESITTVMKKYRRLFYKLMTTASLIGIILYAIFKKLGVLDSSQIATIESSGIINQNDPNVGLIGGAVDMISSMVNIGGLFSNPKDNEGISQDMLDSCVAIENRYGIEILHASNDLNDLKVYDRLANISGLFDKLKLSEVDNHNALITDFNTKIVGVYDNKTYITAMYKNGFVMKNNDKYYGFLRKASINESGDFISKSFDSKHVTSFPFLLKRSLTDDRSKSAIWTMTEYGAKPINILEIGKYTEKQISSVFKELLNDLKYIHENGYCYNSDELDNMFSTLNSEGTPVGIKLDKYYLEEIEKSDGCKKKELGFLTKFMMFASEVMLKAPSYTQKVRRVDLDIGTKKESLKTTASEVAIDFCSDLLKMLYDKKEYDIDSLLKHPFITTVG